MDKNKYRFKVKETIYSVNNHKRKTCTILLTDKELGLPVLVTDYADYLTYKIKRDVYVNSKKEKNIWAVEMFLNYIFFDCENTVDSIHFLKKGTVERFLNEYANGRIGKFKGTGTYPSEQSVIDKRDAISIFLENYMAYNPGKMIYLRPSDFFSIHKDTLRNGKRIRSIDYKLPVTIIHEDRNGLKSLCRDMPISMAELMITAAEIYDPELTFAIVLSMFAGLREGEICNIRQKHSIYGPGIILTLVKIDNKNYECKAMQIDVSEEYILRSDYVDNGDIKRENVRSVYGAFTNLIYKYYLRHMELIKNKPCNDKKPMFLNKNKNRNGLYEAMTIKSYSKRITKLFFQHVLPSCKNNNDADLALFYFEMRNHTWGAHAFRHWFTVFLLFSGVDDIQTLMELRGDKTPEAAREYLKRKGVLMMQYKKSIEKMSMLITDIRGISSENN